MVYMSALRQESEITMYGANPKRPPETGDGSSLKLVAIFPTLQGEGPYVGMPAVFVRLGGCNLACTFCDTEFETFDDVAMADIVSRVKEASLSNGKRTHDLVVITGGEPLRQPIVPLCEALIAEGFAVQIETNGTIYRELPDAVNIVCSPKAVDGKYYALRPDMMARVDALKFLVSAHDVAYKHVPDIGQKAHDVPVYVQPMDEEDEAKNAANRAYAVALCQQSGYRLSLQTHKILGIA